MQEKCIKVNTSNVPDIFKDTAHNEALRRWLDYVAAEGILMDHDFLSNIKAVQAKPLTGPAGSGRAYTYTEYFTTASRDTNMPPIDQVQIILPSDDEVAELASREREAGRPMTLRHWWDSPHADMSHGTELSTGKLGPKRDWGQVAEPSSSPRLPPKDWNAKPDPTGEFKPLLLSHRTGWPSKEREAVDPLTRKNWWDDPHADRSHGAEMSTGQLGPKRDWGKVADPSGLPGLTRKDWNATSEPTREIKPLPPRSLSFDRER